MTETARHQLEHPGISDAVRRVTSEVCERNWGTRLRACVLTGSVARGEGSFVREHNLWRCCGDVEFIAVFRAGRVLPNETELAAVCDELRAGLLASGFSCSVMISPVTAGYLRRMRPHIFGYELRQCGRVLWGEQDILTLIPSFASADIPFEDAWFLLSNRMIELLELACRERQDPGALHYRFCKFYLDMATSFLLFCGEYVAGYADRAERLLHLTNASTGKPGPFSSMADFAQIVDVITRIKLGAEGFDRLPSHISWSTVVADARSLWRWEAMRLTGITENVSDAVLREALLRLQPLRARLRGWAFVLRQSGWHRSWRNWPRWLWMSRRASPRYWIYAAAAQLLFESRNLAERRSSRFDERPLISAMPVDSGAAGFTGRAAADVIAWNYHQFLELTRA